MKSNSENTLITARRNSVCSHLGCVHTDECLFSLPRMNWQDAVLSSFSQYSLQKEEPDTFAKPALLK